MYTSQGWLDIGYLLSKKTPFNVVIGGRGIGKTYGAIKYALENNIVFLLIRRTKAQAALIGNPKLCPVKPVAEELGIAYTIERGGLGQCDILYKDTENGKVLCGFVGALTTFVNMRGFDATEIQLVIFDEFIAELHERAIKHEFDAFVNMYETVNRNRELMGRPPVSVLLLGNSNTLNSAILQGLGVIDKIETMLKREQRESVLVNRGLSIFICSKSPVSEQKANTALYKLTRNTAFSDMALNNTFAYDDFSNIKPMRITPEFILIARFDLAFMYNWREYIYISRHSNGVPPLEFESTELDTERFIRQFPYFYKALINGGVIFEDFELQTLLTKLYI